MLDIQTPLQNLISIGAEESVRVQTPPIVSAAGGVESTYALGFDGVDDGVEVPYSASLASTQTITVSAWVFYRGGIFWVGKNALTGDSSVPDWGVQIWTDRDVWTYVDSYGGVSGTSPSVVPLNQWILFTVVIRGSSTSLVYINGRLIPNTVRDFVAGTVPNTTSKGITIGKNTLPTQFFNGLVDDVRIYNYELTAAEVQSIYRNSSSPPTNGLVAHFPFEEGIGTTTTDTIGGLTGTLTNGPTWQPQVCPRLITNRQTQSWAVQFDGTNDYITVADDSDLDFGTGDFTVSFWMKPSNLGSSNREIGLVSKTTNYENAAGWVFEIVTYGGSATTYSVVFANTGHTVWGNTNASSVTGGLTVDRWIHVTGVRTGTTNKLYINGYEVGSTTHAQVATSVDNTVSLGFGNNGGWQAIPFPGILKDVRMYNVAKTAAEVRQLSRGISDTTNLVGRWNLNEGTGTTASDSSGNGNTGTLTNGPTWTGDVPQWFRQTIESSNALSCDGVNDNVGATIPAQANPTSLSCWVKRNAATPSYAALFVLSSGTGNHAYMYANVNVLHFSVETPAGSDFISTSYTLPLGQWVHVALVLIDRFDRRAFVFGEQKASSVSDKSPTGLASFSIGPGATSAMDLDEVCVHNRALSVPELQDVSAGYLVPASLVARYKFDGNANDAAGSAHGTENGGVGYSTDVPGTL